MSTNKAVRALVFAHELETRGFTLSIINGNVSILPGSKLTGDDKQFITTHRQELMGVLGSRCLSCKRLRDEKSRCWKCFTRLCSVCGRDTGSCFIMMCLRCGKDSKE